MEEHKFQFKCDSCEKSFFNEEILGLHIKSNHKSIIEGWKKCDLCDKTFHSKKAPNHHVKTTYESKTNLECVTCNKGFCNKYDLETHKKLFMKK